MRNKIHPSVRRISILSVFLGVAAMGGLAEAATYSVFAVSVNGSTIPSTNKVTVNPGDIITLEFWGSDWSPKGQKLRAWQINIDADGYSSGDAGELVPFGLDNAQVGIACLSDDDCEAPLTCFEIQPGNPFYCAGPNNDPTLGAFIDSSRPDYVFLNKPELVAIDFSRLSYRYGSFLFSTFDAPVYTVPRYFATLILTVSSDANGTFTIGPLATGTDMRDINGIKILPLELEPVTINVVFRLCEAPIVEGVGSRYLRVIPQPLGSGPQALLVQADCAGAPARYVLAPMPFDIDGDGLDDENVAMLGSTVAVASSFRTTEEWGELYVYDGGISPDTTYLVWGDCGSPGNPGLLDPGSATTCIYGDTVGDPLPGGGWNACDGSVDIVDATAVIEGFQHLSNAAPIYQLDVGSTDDFGIACPPDLAADIIPDVVIVLEAFGSGADTCPRPCP